MGDCEGLAGDEAGEVGAKVDDGVGDVLGVVAAADEVLEGPAGVGLKRWGSGDGFLIDAGDDEGESEAVVSGG